MPSHGPQQLFRRSTGLSFHSSPSPLEDDGPDKPETARQSTGVMSMLKRRSLQVPKPVTGSESPTPSETPTHVHCNTSRVLRPKSAPGALRVKRAKKSENEYDALSDARREAARSRVGDMLFFLRSTLPEEGNDQAIPCPAHDSDNEHGASKEGVKPCSPMIRIGSNQQRRNLHGPVKTALSYEDFIQLLLTPITHPNASVRPGRVPAVCTICNEKFLSGSLDPTQTAAWKIHGNREEIGHFLHMNCLRDSLQDWDTTAPGFNCPRCHSYKSVVEKLGREAVQEMVARMQNELAR
ncbi:hypothetical protein IQ07DRAFT_594179 [Pyrenochaeta sp. DS3sAY3a]|nr:hypothetical protein IQ07DRAFT_594179 [Pyrenochaeta sp. DS3sAY3a]